MMEWLLFREDSNHALCGWWPMSWHEGLGCSYFKRQKTMKSASFRKIVMMRSANSAAHHGLARRGMKE
jgi:hypothetical protein